MFVQELLDRGVRSLSVVGMGKNTGKTFSFGQLLLEARSLGIQVAITTMGLDGEERDSLFGHSKPQIMVGSGQIVANAKTLLLESGLDYEILSTTGIMTPLGEVILARALSAGKTRLAGPATRDELALVRDQLEEIGIDLLFVDGAIDRRSSAAPMVTDTTVLAVGPENSCDRAHLLEKLKLLLSILTLPALKHPSVDRLTLYAQGIKAVYLSALGVQGVLAQHDFLQASIELAEHINQETQAIYIRGMLTDDVLGKILAGAGGVEGFTIVARDPTHVFVGKQSVQRLASHQAVLKVLDPIQISALTVNPFSTSYGHTDPIRLLRDVGQAVFPIPCYDLGLGLRYVPGKEGFDAIS
ncbi:MAG TPA: hypothetical protein DDW87_04615 [Firmicutes bacterium]|nr:hypothetical protein [Bacillota bacterium]